MTNVITLVPAEGRGLQVEYVESSDLPTPWATFRLHGFVDRTGGREHLALTLGSVADGEPVLARVHSECLTGDALFSRRCDCGAQLEAAMKRVAAEGRGVIVYLRQEGRGIGLMNKIRAYRLQDEGMDTVEANQHLGFGDDERRYDAVKPIFEHLGVGAVHLMTNNPRKVEALEALGIQVVTRQPLVAGANPHNHRYLRAKARRLGHWIPI
ncbi:GTP cyclohydrolase II [Pelomicrobium methylotrophicum]|uniref:GTP cyclohydrolase-2 n=1 Tax=Pelomicrobium methylotrophicum TaxID=2602750 RepID=A0A5C7EX09_9PROT|nr:GTP cyclohydrolase II [Pelomicrobium methylotrophicum]TXF12825.1 GTP cyclohydrolase II [Pelomicrobium methylotrophicum]